MILIKKAVEPTDLTHYRLSTPEASYDGLPTDIKEEIKLQLLKEQGFICAYCMSRIDLDNPNNTNIEHYVPQRGAYSDPFLALDYRNMLGVCPGNEGKPYRNQTCDRHRRNVMLTINPHISYSVERIKYSSDGRIMSDDPDVDRDLDKVLNLNEALLKENRKAALSVLEKELIKKKEHGTWKELARRYIHKLSSADKKTPFCGILLWRLNKLSSKTN